MKFSGNKRSGMENRLAKFRCPKMVAMETVTDSLFFFNARYLSRGSRYYLEILRICCPGPKIQFMFGTNFPQNYRFSVIMKQSLDRAMWCTGLNSACHRTFLHVLLMLAKLLLTMSRVSFLYDSTLSYFHL